MAKFIGMHSIPGFTKEMLEMAQQDASKTSNIQLLQTHYDSSTGRVICQVEAPDRESFIAWLNRINMPYDEICKIDLEYVSEKESPSP